MLLQTLRTYRSNSYKLTHWYPRYNVVVTWLRMDACIRHARTVVDIVLTRLQAICIVPGVCCAWPGDVEFLG